MNLLSQQKFTAAIAAIVIAMFAAGSVSAQEIKEVRSEAREDAKKATEVLNDMLKRPDDFIPRSLLENAKAIAVFPDVVKAAFIVGGRGGHGVVSVKKNGAWSMPIFYNIGGASWGAQIGVKRTDYILLFMNDAALKDLDDETLQFGGDLSFAAGPVGRTAAAETTTSLKTGILTWSHSAGAFIGASLKGAEINSDNSKNNAIYGMGASSLMANPASAKDAELPKEITEFTKTVTRYAR